MIANKIFDDITQKIIKNISSYYTTYTPIKFNTNSILMTTIRYNVANLLEINEGLNRIIINSSLTGIKFYRVSYSLKFSVVFK